MRVKKYSLNYICQYNLFYINCKILYWFLNSNLGKTPITFRGARAFLYPHGRNMNDVPIPKGMLSSIPYDMRGLPIRDAGISQPVPTVALPSALANATPDQQRMMLGKSLYALVEMLKQIMRPK